LPDTRPQSAFSPKSDGLLPDGDLVAWVREHWVPIAGVVLLLLLLWWLSGGEPRNDNGRYVLVKDDVPCQAAGEGESRRWCYVVLDSRTGKLEERVRRFGSRERR
jgi:hypothetical protein